MKKTLEMVKFEEMQNKTFRVVQVIEKLCELCRKPLGTKERMVRTLKIYSHKDYGNFLIRARVHDRVEVDLEKNEIRLFDHDFPGDVHSGCVEKYSEG